ncbi:MAG: ribokinase [Puniceicoccaceae bacterium]
MNPSPSPRVLVVGSCSTDYIIRTSKLPEVGETVTNGSFQQTFGGKGANTAVAASKLGARVSFLGAFGGQASALPIQQALTGYGLDLNGSFSFPEDESGAALILVGPGGENYISVAPGANHLLTAEHLRQRQDLFQNCGIVLLQNEIPRSTNAEAIKLAKQYQRPVVLNFAPAAADHFPLLGGVDYLIVNEVEAGQLLKTAGKVPPSDLRALAPAIASMASQWVVVTLGPEGVCAASQTGEVLSFPSYPVRAVDTTAAGDTFCGALAIALLEGSSMADALAFAQGAAAFSVTKPGCMVSSPTRSELEAFLLLHPAH